MTPLPDRYRSADSHSITTGSNNSGASVGMLWPLSAISAKSPLGRACDHAGGGVFAEVFGFAGADEEGGGGDLGEFGPEVFGVPFGLGLRIPLEDVRA